MLMRNEVIKQKINSYNRKAREENLAAKSRNIILRDALSTNNLLSRKVSYQHKLQVVSNIEITD